MSTDSLAILTKHASMPVQIYGHTCLSITHERYSMNTQDMHESKYRCAWLNNYTYLRLTVNVCDLSMHMSIHMSMHMSIRISIHMSIHIYAHVYTHIYTHVYAHVQAHICMYVYNHVYTHV